MKDPEDEAFEELALKQGHWVHTSGNRKRQIMEHTKMEQAFPNPHRTDMTGMTLRDYFAAKAMQSILSENPDYHTKYKFLDLADFSYQCADAMMKEREA
tara:strand:+ start:368 stop:664 length:297 start_codon:yes stop_codon:yes gene_type:complete